MFAHEIEPPTIPKHTQYFGLYSKRQAYPRPRLEGVVRYLLPTDDTCFELEPGDLLVHPRLVFVSDMVW